MSEQKKNLFTDFESSSKKDWAQTAAVFEQYNWQIDGNIALAPYYDQRDLADLQKFNYFRNRPLNKEKTRSEARSWENTPKVNVKDASANQLALEALNNGADGIIFDLTHAKELSFDALLQNILVDYCSVSFIEASFNDLKAYCSFLSDKEIDPLAVSGFFSMNKYPDANADHLQVFKKTINYPKLKVFNLSSNATGITDEIADLLLQAVSILYRLTNHFELQQVISKMAVTVHVSTDYFGEIAKVKAVRMLFFQLFRAYGYDEFKPEDLYINCISTPWVEEKYQPHANMLKATTAAMAAIIGGCDSLLVEPEDYTNPLMVRIARNVSTVIKEESYLNKTTDPVAGTYYIEVLKDKLAEKAWKIFQEKVKVQKR